MQTKVRFIVHHDRPTEASTSISIRGTTNHVSARIEGPYCSTGRTLRSTIQFSPQENGLSCQLVDPVFWSPDFPAYYRIDILDGDEVIYSQRLGIRKLECSRGSLFLNSRRWVLRAAWSDSLTVDECQRENLAIVCDDPSDQFLDDATDKGVFVVLNLEQCVEWQKRLLQLSRFPCVGMTILRETIQQVPTNNQILVHRCSTNSLTSAPWAHLLMPEYSALKTMRSSNDSRPLVCYRIGSEPLARISCDHLQRDLAPEFDLAGYVVSNKVNEIDG